MRYRALGRALKPHRASVENRHGSRDHPQARTHPPVRAGLRLGRRRVRGCAARARPGPSRLADLRGQRPRLGPRDRHEPVGRLRLRQERLHLQADPLALLPDDDTRAGAAAARPRAAGERLAVARGLVRGRFQGQGRRRCHLRGHGQQVHAQAEARAPGRRGRQAAAAHRPAHYHGREEPARARRPHVPRDLRGLRRRQQAQDRQHRGARAVPLRRRPGRGARRLAGRGAQGPGRRRPLVRARRTWPAATSTSTRTRAVRSTSACRRRSPPRRRP